MNGSEIRAASSLAIIYVLRMLGLFMVMPVMAIEAMNYPDYSPLLVGVAIGGYGLTQAFLQIPMGMLSDRLGRKPVIVLGLVVFAIGSGIAAQADSLVMVLVGRILQGAGAIAGAIMALASDVSREGQRAKVMAIIGIAIGFSFYLAVLIGPILANNWGLSGIFAITGALALLCIPLVIWVVPKPQQTGASGDMLPQKSQFSELFTSPQLWRLNVSVMILHLYITLLFVNLPLTLTQFDYGLNEQWSFYLPVLLLSVVGMTFLMRATSGKTPPKMLRFCVVLMALAFGVLTWNGMSWGFVFAAIVLFFIGFNYLEANFPAIVSSIAPAGQRGTAMGIYASFQFFGAFLGGTLSGFISEAFDPEYSYATGILVAALWIALLAGVKEVQKVKRVMLYCSFSADGVAVLHDKLQSLQGVVETTIAPNEQVVYLKVTADFNLSDAQLLVESRG